jgi:hypothetical protein
MPIEFPCSACSKLLRVGDESAGKACKCPSCGSRERIPELDVVEVFEAIDAATDESKIRVACPNCLHQLVCDPSLIGTKGQCRSCKCIFVISKDPKLAIAIDTSDAKVFSCPKCSQLFEGKKEMEGKRGKCHVCNEVFSIELREAEEPVIEIQESTPAPKKTKAPISSKQPIRFACSNCSGTMEVPGATAGKQTSCPYCKAMVAIPTVSQGPRKPTAVARPKAPSSLPVVVPTVVPMAVPQNDLWQNLNAPMAASLPMNMPQYDSNPYAASAPQSYAPRRSGRREPWMYVLPGVLMSIVSGLAILAAAITLSINVYRFTVFWDRFAQADGTKLSMFIAGQIFGIVLTSVVGIYGMVGSIAMIRRSNLKNARTIAIMMCIPCSCMFLAFPLGIWALVLLFSDAAKRDFGEN